MTEPPLSPHLTRWSDDGTHWWDGSAWVARPDVPARQAELDREAAARRAQEQAKYAADYAAWQSQLAAAGVPSDNPFAAPGAPTTAPPPPPSPAWAPHVEPEQRPMGYATGFWSFLLALVGLFVWILGGVAAIVLGHISRSQARKAHLKPNIWSRWGLFLGYLEIVLFALLIILLASAGSSPSHPA